MEKDPKIGFFLNVNPGVIIAGLLYADWPSKYPQAFQPFMDLNSSWGPYVPVTNGTIASLTNAINIGDFPAKWAHPWPLTLQYIPKRWSIIDFRLPRTSDRHSTTERVWNDLRLMFRNNRARTIQGGWNQVNGSDKQKDGSKKWSGIVNGAATPNSTGKRTPLPKENVRDNKVAYILFYQRIETWDEWGEQVSTQYDFKNHLVIMTWEKTK